MQLEEKTTYCRIDFESYGYRDVITYNNIVLNVKSKENYYKIIKSKDYKEVLEYGLKKLNEVQTLKSLDVLEFITKMDSNIENIKISGMLVPFWKLFFCDMINLLEQKVGDIYIKKNKFLEYKKIQDFQYKMKNINDFFFDKHMINFTKEQSNVSKIYAELFEEKTLHKYLKMINGDK